MRLAKTYRKIWAAALPFQDKLGGEGHARIVTEFAIKLLRRVEAKPEIVMPAAILHDIGWAKLTKKERNVPFRKEVLESPALRHRAKRKHELVGARLARRILKELKYPPELSNRIVEIISGHDTRKGFLSAEDGIVRDADKLWRFSPTGFRADMRRFKYPPEYGTKRLRKEMKAPGYFHSKEAAKLARAQLKELS